MTMTSGRSKFYFYNSMTCLLKVLERKYVTVELRNNTVIKGQLDWVESTMNLNMSNVVLTNVHGQITTFEKFYVKGRHIMFVMVPEEVDIKTAMEWHINKTEYFKEKERKYKAKTFEKNQKRKAKDAAKLNKQEQT